MNKIYEHSPKYDILNGIDETLKIYTFAVKQYKMANSGEKIEIQETLARNLDEAKQQIRFRNRGLFFCGFYIIWRED